MNPKLLRLISIFFSKPIRPLPSSPSPQRCFPFSTTTPRTTSSKEFYAPNRFSPTLDDVVSGTSAAYSHALKFQRPATVEWSQSLENKASFIGTVTRQPKAVNSKNGNFGVFTVLRVSSSRSNGPDCSSFKVVLWMWDGLAEFASKHLKPNDFIYVSGCLGSYTKADPNGNLQVQVNYKLVVKELDFVAQKVGYEGHKKLESIEAEAGIQSNPNRLYLWQVFFSNPHEWWDCRKRKLNPKQPDFKHKDTGEALWLSKYDPPWVKKQLQLLDSKIAGGGVVGCRSRVSTWVYDE